VSEIVLWEITASASFYILVFLFCWLGIVFYPSRRAAENRPIIAARDAFFIWTLCVTSYFFGAGGTLLLLIALGTGGAVWLRYAYPVLPSLGMGEKEGIAARAPFYTVIVPKASI
jgi:hypothetical protein